MKEKNPKKRRPIIVAKREREREKDRQREEEERSKLLFQGYRPTGARFPLPIDWFHPLYLLSKKLSKSQEAGRGGREREQRRRVIKFEGTIAVVLASCSVKIAC